MNATNKRYPRFFCVRTSHNGRHVRQLCDETSFPLEGNGMMTGAVRAAVEEMWNGLLIAPGVPPDCLLIAP